MFRLYLYLYFWGQNWDLTLPTSRVHLKDPHGPGDAVSILWKQEYTEYVLQCMFPVLPRISSMPSVRSLSLSVSPSLPMKWGHLWSLSGNVCEAPSDFCLEGSVNSNACLVYRWLQENGGGGRVPNIASAFIFDIIKRSPGQGPDWSFLEYKMQMCAFMPGNTCHACGQHFTSRTGTEARESIWVLVILYRVSCQFEVGQKKDELWSLPLPDLRDSGLLARPSAYE